MRAVWRTGGASLGIESVSRHLVRHISSQTLFKEGDNVLFRRADDPAGHVLLRRLKEGGRVETQNGVFTHAEVIGKRALDTVATSKKIEYRLHHPTLAEYVRLTPRIVTPIYPQDANLIVSLLDLHPTLEDPPCDTNERASPPLEILECGTGHGSLTLHLAHAVHAANASLKPQENANETRHETRRAIIHSIDVSKKHSKHAEGVVRGFRGGLYAGNVDFHVGTVPEFLESRRRQQQDVGSGAEFLDHAILDLPGVQHVLAPTAEALRADGKLVVFVPSVTQIMDCVRVIREERLPLVMVQCLELGGGMSGGREWNVKISRIRKAEKRSVGRERGLIGSTSGGDDTSPSPPETVDVEVSDPSKTYEDLKIPAADDNEAWGMVCRPRAGDMVVGGGFVAVWSKKKVDPISN